jgi:hypothetical protein
MHRPRLTISTILIASSFATGRVTSAQRQAGTPATRLSELSGFYRATQVDAAPTCSPRRLPAPPKTADSARYVSPGAGSFGFWARVRLTDTSVTITPSDSMERDVAPPIAGNRQPDGSFLTMRKLVLDPEPGPRQGGRRLAAVVEVRGHPRFERSGATVRWRANGVFTYRYHADSATGPIYTTCRHSYTVSGVRMAR